MIRISKGKRRKALIPAIAIAALLAAFGWQMQGRDAGTNLRPATAGIQRSGEAILPAEEKTRRKEVKTSDTTE